MNVIDYSIEARIGMFVLGYTFTAIGAYFTIKMIKTGEIVLLGRGKVLVREKLREIMPLRFKYFHALAYTLSFGPLTLMLGLISIFVLISSIIIFK